MTFTPDMLRTIARNAGRVPKHVMARDLGISLSFLERKAAEHGYDLRVVPKVDPDPEMVTSAHNPTPRPESRPGIHARTKNVTASLLLHDVAQLDEVGARFGIKRSRVLGRLVENARAKGLLFDLASLPAPMPDKTGEFDEV